MNSPNTPESIVLYTPAIPCSGTAGILALLLPSPAHGKKEERASPFRPPSCLLSPARGKRPSMYDAKAFGPFAFLAYEKSGTGGSIPPSLRLAFPAHEGNGSGSPALQLLEIAFPAREGICLTTGVLEYWHRCFPRARRNMGKAREATPEKPRFPHMPGTAEWPILFGWGRLSHAGRMMPPPYSRTGPPRASGTARCPNRRPHWTGRYLLPFYRFGVTLLPIFGARTHAEGSPFHSEVHLCAGVNGTSPL